MNHDELYTPGNCRLVAEWLDIAVVDQIAFFKNSEVSPELIREALAKDGVVVFQVPGESEGDPFELHLVGNGWGKPIIVEAGSEEPITFRHALFAAAVEYLKSAMTIAN